MVELDTDITRDIHNLVAKNRKGLFTVDSSTKKNVFWGYNCAIS